MANFPGALLRGRQKIDIPPVVVIGLGRFGGSLAYELTRCGVEVLGIDADERVAREYSQGLSDALVADTTDAEALRQLGIPEMGRVVLGIGSALEASILTASNLVELGVADIWAKADSESHARILRQLGVHHVVRPEHDTGRRVAHLLGGRFQDFAELADNYGVIKMVPPRTLLDAPLDPTALWRTHHIQVVSARTSAGAWQPVYPGARLTPTDLVVLAGAPDDLERFSRL
ncbi:potassium channel family protein [Corynebacterium timonense]|uniref:Trk system potassium uptake protein TrkA n=1 Tax=Corynebacterium timonense TaxID=441500 RepID=A0A1H1L340_9CORY|nr:TrkA family potassium uptake protein [Corynebacterium timonense]SDR68946.1 trk system potassium uptake protein TrkA [Corynebacterium timonense]